jgi:predicted Zn-dependent protease
MPLFGNGSSSRGLNVSWIVAIVIALGGIVSYYGARQKNPVTGEVQHVKMSVDQEKSLGLEAAPQMAQQMGGAVDPRSDPAAALVAEVGNRIVQNSEAARSPYVGNFHFRLLNDPRTINAFALPGGQVFITRALFDRLQNEGQLAGVLGHEIGHVINRHAAEHMAKGQLGSVLATAVGVGASGDRDSRGYMAAAAAQMANQMAQLHFSRDDESEADGYGMKIMAQAGYDPQAMLGVMQILQQASAGGRQPEILSTHPLPQTRIDEIKDRLAKIDYSDRGRYKLTTGRPLDHATLANDRRAPQPDGSRRDKW